MAKAICNITDQKEWRQRGKMGLACSGRRGVFGSSPLMEYVTSARVADRLTLPLSLLILICMWKLPRVARGAIIDAFLTLVAASPYG